MIKTIDLHHDDVMRLVDVWEQSVRDTHDFITEAMIDAMRPEVHTAFASMDAVVVYEDHHMISGFMGVLNQKVEMLFLDASARGHGVGSRLIHYAISEFSVNRVDVNEQNYQARGFYEHLGFEVYDRSECDDAGRPFPILHMKRSRVV
ncbi:MULTISPECIES: GNAT family N-acetyltransferase [unclassified Erysipelothrix]|uniref:GNAT family N-acetyltransferase n=1 Tax=unclassified Erysipelothrix TaxID=2624170 RepID=UPI0013770F03|nr:MULTISPECIES: GNAT family N-acetyltransferase [unclassified Erysipelothrix]MBK2402759.1 GNAT family N-acetyltransferase [Erysipelothrix sp. strain 2 (EsS2-6-Brazil)]MBK2404150.1 GNAT family N-acetyltransferase [Erysipelothrix sp. strain 2 (EsS2-7-Brazil)]NBA01747.1 GNAT family N-acetyltransferase [Erysipelothrix rhusiopathiae]